MKLNLNNVVYMHSQNQVKPKTDQLINSAVMIASAASGSFASCMFFARQVSHIQSHVKEGITPTACAHIAFRVGMIAGAILCKPVVGVVTEGISICEHIYEIGCNKGNKADHLTQIALSSLSIATQVTFSLELIVLNLAINILSEAKSAFVELRNGNYIEACGHLAAGSIRGYQNRGYVEKLIKKWAPKENTQTMRGIMSAVSAIRNFDHLQEAAEAVNQRIDAVRNGTAEKIKASAGVILTRKTENGDIEVLMGRLNKLDRPNPKDDAGVHGSYGLFSGGVEMKDAESGIPAVFTAAAREVEEESLGALSRDNVLDLLSLPTTKLIKNAGWKHFTAASFHTNISSEDGDKIVNAFNGKIADHPQHEITDLAWVSLKHIVEAQAGKEERYNALRAELEQAQGKPFSADELTKNKDLGKVYNENVALDNGIRIAHFVARTIFGLKNSL